MTYTPCPSLRLALTMISACMCLCMAASETSGKDYRYPDRDVPREVWSPVPGSSTEAARVRVVDFGQVNCRWQEDSGIGQRHKAGHGWHGQGVNEELTDVDLDGNPNTPDKLCTKRFNLSDPFDPMGTMVPIWDDQMPSSRWYGGFAIYFTNRGPKSRDMTENYVNSAETPNDRQPANNWAFHAYSFIKNSNIYGYYSPIWMKRDFEHGGDKHRVSFDASSRIGLYRQRYFSGFEGIRFVVRQGGQLYLSENIYKDWHGPPGGMSAWGLDIMCPLDSKWAAWNPTEGEWDNLFEPDGAQWKTMDFNDVEAVGWYLFKNERTDQPPCSKWECFECYATVNRPALVCERLNMAGIPAGKTDGISVPAFHMSTCEVPYQVWKDVYRRRHAIPQWVMDPPQMIFDEDGDMGSMDYSAVHSELMDAKHSQREPVTDITLYDALAWCNAISEDEGREPVYYVDEGRSEVFRRVIESCWLKNPPARPSIYVKWDADGFRLPTPAEWKLAMADAQVAEGQAWTAANAGQRTHAVGGKTANKHGLHDMVGNVWELVWTYGDQLDPEPQTITVMGGGFDHDGSTNHLRASANPYGESPFVGSFNIGLRIVRRMQAAAAVDSKIVPLPGNLSWTISPDDRTDSFTPPAMSQELIKVPGGNLDIYEMTPFELAKTETTFSDWRLLSCWAESQGYSFDHDGDMGSMDFKMLINEHSPNEPVMDVSLQDSAAWCNALSEKHGRTPVFYNDEGYTDVYRKALVYRPLHMRAREQRTDARVLPPDDPGPPKPDIEKYGVQAYSLPGYNIRMRWDADGFRPPTVAEWYYAYSGGMEKSGRNSTYPWGTSASDIDKYAWYFGNSDMRSHPVATKQANAFGLHDMSGNAIEWCSDSVGKGGKIGWMRGWNKNPIFLDLSIETGQGKWRAACHSVGFLYDSLRAFEVGRLPNQSTHGTWCGGFPAWSWPDISFRPLAAQAGAYPVNGVDDDYNPSEATPLDFNRQPGQKAAGKQTKKGAKK